LGGIRQGIDRICHAVERPLADRPMYRPTSLVLAAVLSAALTASVSAHPPPPTPPQKTFAEYAVTRPFVPLQQLVVTQAPSTLTVTVARVDPDDAFRSIFALRGAVGDLDPFARTIWSRVYPADDGLQRDVTLPALSGGLYEVRYATTERTAIQRLTISSMWVTAMRTARDAVALAHDLRTGRRLNNVWLLLPTKTSVVRLRATDGLLRFPSDWHGPVFAVSNMDGSIVVDAGGEQASQASVWYVELDRRSYRLSDSAYFRVFSREPSERSVLWFDGPTFRQGEGFYSSDFVGASSMFLGTGAPGLYRIGPYGASVSTVPGLQIETAAANRTVPLGGVIRFVISAESTNNIPERVGLRYFWAWTTTPESFPLAMRLQPEPGQRSNAGVVSTDDTGRAELTIPAQRSGNVELFVFDPTSGDVAATARSAVVASRVDRIVTHVPFGAVPPGCTPLAFSAFDGDVPQAGRRLVVEMHRNDRWPTPDPHVAFKAGTVTGPGGFALVRWCERRNGNYAVTVNGKGDETVSVAPTANPVNAPVSFVAPEDLSVPGRPVHVVAIIPSNRDGFALSGSGDRFDAVPVHPVDGIARFTVPSRNDMDDFRVAVFEDSDLWQPTVATVHAAQRRHMLHVSVACSRGAFTSHEPVRLCARITDWQGQRVAAHLYVSVSLVSGAAIARAQASENEAYETLFQPQDPNGQFLWWPMNVATTGATSYLLPTPSPPPPVQVKPGTSGSITANTNPTPPPPQTVMWSDVRCDRISACVIDVTWPDAATNGTYLLHVVAVRADGSIGDRYTWFTLSSSGGMVSQ
jgi:hypothetical protein